MYPKLKIVMHGDDITTTLHCQAKSRHPQSRGRDYLLEIWIDDNC